MNVTALMNIDHLSFASLFGASDNWENNVRPQAAPEKPQHLTSPVILLVEDDPMILKVTQLTLSRAGYQVYTAASAKEAEALWQQHSASITLLLADVVIEPGITGVDLAHKFARTKPGLKVLLTSGFTQEIVDDELKNNSDTAFLQKPFDATTVIEAVHQTLAAKEPVASLVSDITRITI